MILIHGTQDGAYKAGMQAHAQDCVNPVLIREARLEIGCEADVMERPPLLVIGIVRIHVAASRLWIFG